LAGRGEGLQPAGQARDPDDGLHLPGVVRGHPAAGRRAAGDRPLLGAHRYRDAIALTRWAFPPRSITAGEGILTILASLAQYPVALAGRFGGLAQTPAG